MINAQQAQDLSNQRGSVHQGLGGAYVFRVRCVSALRGPRRSELVGTMLVCLYSTPGLSTVRLADSFLECWLDTLEISTRQR